MLQGHFIISLFRFLAWEPVYFSVFLVLSAFTIGQTIEERGRVRAAKQRVARLISEIDGKPAHEVAAHLEQAAENDKTDPLNAWIIALRNSKNLQNPSDASALTDAFWSREKERNALPRFLAKNAILVGLIFTVMGLTVAVSGIDLPDAQAGFDPSYFDKLSKQLGVTLGGMATAFFSSCLGLVTNLFLTAFILFTFEREQNEYLETVDVFFQGHAIPAYAALTKTDEAQRFETVVKELSTELRAANERMEAAFHEVKDSYESQFERLGGFSDQLGQTASTINSAMDKFGTDIKVFTIACDRFHGASEKIELAYEAGVERLCNAQAELQKIVDDGFEIFESLDEANKEIHANIKATTENYQTVSERLSSYQEAMREALTANEKGIMKVCEKLEAVSESSVSALDELRERVPQSVAEVANVAATIRDGLSTLLDEEKQVASGLQDVIGLMQSHETELGLALSRVYDDHRTAMGDMYAEITESFQEHLDAATLRSMEQLEALVPDVAARTQDRLTVLEERFASMIAGHSATVETLRELQAALDFNADKLHADLDQRKEMIAGVLTATVAQLSNDVNHSIQDLNSHLRQSLTKTMQHSSDETRAYLKEFSEAISTKYEHLLEAQLAASKREG